MDYENVHTLYDYIYVKIQITCITELIILYSTNTSTELFFILIAKHKITFSMEINKTTQIPLPSQKFTNLHVF